MKGRISWVDRAKALGMALVFYGHMTEALVDEGYRAAFPQFKFIYSFHMPLFFLMAGFFFKRRHPTLLAEVKDLILRRLVPVLFFGAMALPFWPLDLYLGFGRVRFDLIALRSYHYILGQPELNTITWFLVCLFTTEVVASLLLPKVRQWWGLLILGVVTFRFGLLMTANIKETVTSLGIVKNAWYIHEALVALGFYTLGYLAFRTLQDLDKMKLAYRLVLLILTLALALFTFNLNQPYNGFAVIMKISEHGVSGWFLLAALAGSFGVILLSTLLPGHRILDLIGRNTLVMIGISGLFHEFFNPILLRSLPVPDTALGVTLASLGLSLGSMALSLPVVGAINRFVPQLVGQPYREGPQLPPLDRFFRFAWAKLKPGR